MTEQILENQEINLGSNTGSMIHSISPEGGKIMTVGGGMHDEAVDVTYSTKPDQPAGGIQTTTTTTTTNQFAYGEGAEFQTTGETVDLGTTSQLQQEYQMEGGIEMGAGAGIEMEAGAGLEMGGDAQFTQTNTNYEEYNTSASGMALGTGIEYGGATGETIDLGTTTATQYGMGMEGMATTEMATGMTTEMTGMATTGSVMGVTQQVGDEAVDAV